MSAQTWALGLLFCRLYSVLLHKRQDPVLASKKQVVLVNNFLKFFVSPTVSLEYEERNNIDDSQNNILLCNKIEIEFKVRRHRHFLHRVRVRANCAVNRPAPVAKRRELTSQ